MPVSPLLQIRVPQEIVSLISRLAPPLRKKTRAGLDALLRNPAEGKPLRAELLGLWSLRVGRFRIIYLQVRSLKDTLRTCSTTGPVESPIGQSSKQRPCMYRVAGKILEVVAVGPRSRIYQETAERLAGLKKA